MSDARPALTYRDYEMLPDDGRRYEIHDGELSVTPAPSPQHQICSINLLRVVDAHVRAHGLGLVLYAPLDVILSDRSGDTTIVQPDIVFVETGRLGIVSRRGIEGPPTLAIEILSPWTTRIDRVTKLALYGRFGMPCYWIVDTDARAVDAYTLERESYGAVRRVAGDTAVDLPPFTDLRLVPSALWP
jgi:Uma2 family endonuclease